MSTGGTRRVIAISPLIWLAAMENDFEPGQITSFRHTLDIHTGLLTIDLDLRADLVWQGLYEIGKTLLPYSPRTLCDTRRRPGHPGHGFAGSHTSVSDAVKVNQDIRIYLNTGIYNTAHAKWSRSCVQKNHGTVVLAQRPKTCTATLAVAVDGPDAIVDAEKGVSWFYSAGNDTYFLHRSGFVLRKPRRRQRRLGEEPSVRECAAMRRSAKRQRSGGSGFTTDHLSDCPTEDLAMWYARSMYYLGVFFGNTDIPPGCNAASVESFAGAICPGIRPSLQPICLALHEPPCRGAGHNELVSAGSAACREVRHRRADPAQHDGEVFRRRKVQHAHGLRRNRHHSAHGERGSQCLLELPRC